MSFGCARRRARRAHRGWPRARSLLCLFIPSLRPSAQRAPGAGVMLDAGGGPCPGGGPSPPERAEGRHWGQWPRGLQRTRCPGRCTGVPPGPSGSRPDLAHISASSRLPRGSGVPSRPSPASLAASPLSLPWPCGALSMCCSISQPCFSLPPHPTQHRRSAQTALRREVS